MARSFRVPAAVPALSLVGTGVAIAAVLLSALHLWPMRTPRASHSIEAALNYHAPPPSPLQEPQLVKPLTPELARAENERMPFTTRQLEPAFGFAGSNALADPRSYHQALQCLTAAVYYEAGGENEKGQRAIAQVVLNRVRSPAFPARICDVVYQGSERNSGCQFTFACDGSLARRPDPAGWERARKIAQNALAGAVEASVGMATHYHADWVVPYWAPHLDKIARVGAHIFYDWPGYWGRRSSFTQAYAGEAIPVVPHDTSTGLLLTERVDPANSITLLGAPVRNGLSASARQTWEEDEPARTLLADGKSDPLLADRDERLLLADQGGHTMVAGSSAGGGEPSSNDRDRCVTLEHLAGCLPAPHR